MNPRIRSPGPNDDLARDFANLMTDGRVGPALRLLHHKSKGHVLDLDSHVNADDPSSSLVRDVLHEKHPPQGPIDTEVILSNETLPSDHDPHFVLFDNLNSDLIRKTALRTTGAAGPSGVDALGWRRFCTSFKASCDLCHSLASVARRLCTSYVDPSSLSAFVAGRLIALDKNPGVRPIGVGEVARRIICKAILVLLNPDILEAVGPLQLCAGQDSGCEAAVHFIRHLYSDSSTDGLLFVDASNAFNSLNREVALRNILHLCPSLGRVLVNTYRVGVNMYIGGESILSVEGTTQGDPMAMAMYALGTLPLIHSSNLDKHIQQVWYADDGSAGGSLPNLLDWWNQLSCLGPKFGFFPNARKSVLLVKPDLLADAQQLFSDHNLNIVSDGAKVLGSPIGTPDFINRWINNKVQSWVDEIHCLASISHSQPQSAYSALTHGVMNGWHHVFRTCPEIATSLLPLENALRIVLLPAITGQDAPNNTLRELFALPCRLGGLNIPDPTSASTLQFSNSLLVSSPLISLLLEQGNLIPSELLTLQHEAKLTIKSNKAQSLSERARSTREALSPPLQKLFDSANEKGSSIWLSVLPLKSHGYHLHKGAFRDGLCLRYGWDPPHLPDQCVCGSPFSVDHAFNCPRGGFQILRHNEVRDITASLMKEVCHNVTIEPVLQPLSGETLYPRSAIVDDNARSDVRAEGFWDCRQQQAFFDVKVFNPSAASYRNKSLQSCFRRLEAGKRREYQDRIINVEHGSFSPLIFSTSGSMGPSASVVFRRLASLVSTKRDELYSKTILFIRCQVCFALLRSAVRCLRGSRSTYKPDIANTNIDLALTEGQVTYQTILFSFFFSFFTVLSLTNFSLHYHFLIYNQIGFKSYHKSVGTLLLVPMVSALERFHYTPI